MFHHRTSSFIEVWSLQIIFKAHELRFNLISKEGFCHFRIYCLARSELFEEFVKHFLALIKNDLIHLLHQLTQCKKRERLFSGLFCKRSAMNCDLTYLMKLKFQKKIKIQFENHDQKVFAKIRKWFLNSIRIVMFVWIKRKPEIHFWPTLSFGPRSLNEDEGG